MNGPNSIAKRAPDGRGALGWTTAPAGVAAVGFGLTDGTAGVADATDTGLSSGAGGGVTGARLMAATGESGVAAAAGAGATGRGAGIARAGAGAGDSSRCRKISLGRGELPNMPSRHPASPPSAASRTATTAPITSLFDF